MHQENEELDEGLFEDFCELALYLLPQQLFAFQLFFQIVLNDQHHQHAHGDDRVHDQDFLVDSSQFLGEYRQNYRHHSETHHCELRQYNFLINEHGENGVLKLAFMIMRFIPTVKEAGRFFF